MPSRKKIATYQLGAKKTNGEKKSEKKQLYCNVHIKRKLLGRRFAIIILQRYEITHKLMAFCELFVSLFEFFTNHMLQLDSTGNTFDSLSKLL